MIRYNDIYKMKKVFLMALLAIFSSFSVISCGKEDLKDKTGVNDGSGAAAYNPFAGNTYKAIGEGRDEDDYFEFQESKVSWGKDNWFNYTFNETTFTLSKGTTEVAVVSYSFSKDKTTLFLSSSAGISGTYVKQ